MKSYMRTSYLANLLLAGVVSIGVSILTGCGMGQIMSPNSTQVTTAGLSGKVHGGPNSIVGAKVALYSTTSTDYGVGNFLANSDAPTDADGSFTISSTYTCPTGQYAYVVIYGGNTGGGNNPNSILVAPVSTCAALTHSTFTYVSELTTITTAYALGNFTKVTGDAVNGYTVGIGAPATNNAATGCVANTYYSGCTATAAAGLAHAFANALMLVDNSTGQVNYPTTATGATIPAAFINGLGNVLQACVNSTGGGTDATTGLPTTTTTTAGGTTHDGTVCGKLFAYTSYTSNGNPTNASTPGTLNAPGNTLSAMMNLAKRPSGSATLFAPACASGGTTGTIPAATCIFNLSSGIGYYNTPAAMVSAPTDWMLGISYPQGSFSAQQSSATNCTTLKQGLLEPFMVATDINDNVTILNENSTSGACYNVIAIGFDGTPLGTNDFDGTTVAPIWIANDQYGHAIVPALKANQVRVYEYAAGGTTASDSGDSTLTLEQTIGLGTGTTDNGNYANAALAAVGARYLAVDNSGDVLMTSEQGGVSGGGLGWCGLSTAAHVAPSYTCNSPTTSNTRMSTVSFDLKNNGLSITSATAASKLYVVSANGTKTNNNGNTFGNANTGQTIYADSSIASSSGGETGKAWSIENGVGSYASSLVVDLFGYTGALSGTPAAPTAPSAPTATPTPIAASPGPGQIDGGDVIWFADEGVGPSYVRAYDTVNNYTTPQYVGCEFSSNPTTCNTSSASVLFSKTRGIAIDAAGDIWVANGASGQLNEVIGLAAPTWPLYIHNGLSNKPIAP